MGLLMLKGYEFDLSIKGLEVTLYGEEAKEFFCKEFEDWTKKEQ